MTVVTPERSLDQRYESLRRANEVRSFKAEVKQDLKAGRRSLRELLLDPPADLATARVFELVLASPKYGRVKANRVLQSCRISPAKTLGGLTQRQRMELASRIRDGRPRPVYARDTDGQHMRALTLANTIRFARAQLKRDIESGAKAVADVIFDPPAEAEGMTIAELLGAQRRWGDTRVSRFLGARHIAEGRLVSALTDRQREMLADELAEPPARTQITVAVTRSRRRARNVLHLHADGGPWTLCGKESAESWRDASLADWFMSPDARCRTCTVLVNGLTIHEVTDAR